MLTKPSEVTTLIGDTLMGGVLTWEKRINIRKFSGDVFDMFIVKKYMMCKLIRLPENKLHTFLDH